MTKPTNEEEAAHALRATMDRANETLTNAVGALIAAERARGVDHPTALLGVACALAELVGVSRARLAATLYGGRGREFHERATTFLATAAPALVAAVRERDAEIARLRAELVGIRGATVWPDCGCAEGTHTAETCDTVIP